MTRSSEEKVTHTIVVCEMVNPGREHSGPYFVGQLPVIVSRSRQL